jgi:hypothetical protein
VKTAGVDESILVFSGKARVFESQDAAVEGILGDTVHEGDVVIIRYEGPKGGPGMQEMLYPTSYIKSKGLGKACALFTDGRFSGGSSGLVIGHASPEAAEGGAIGLVEEGDMIDIDIPARTINLRVTAEELAHRRGDGSRGDAAWKPVGPRALRLAGAAGLRRPDHVGRPRRRARPVAAEALKFGVRAHFSPCLPLHERKMCSDPELFDPGLLGYLRLSKILDARLAPLFVFVVRFFLVPAEHLFDVLEPDEGKHHQPTIHHQDSSAKLPDFKKAQDQQRGNQQDQGHGFLQNPAILQRI